ncbi:E3 ubiquitin-protein ligase tom1 [Diatrype stigma]|uniref:HECT-type E3 ubiquitin transferase n=1 Tax=Diatrype stigma TaxID=117547 RepID=A0AAN9UR60_9PEZI
MGKITKTIQPKHKETLSPWLQEYVDEASSAPLPLLPKVLATFPARWPFPRGDLYHWIPLLNRFDDILESFCSRYKLTEGPQTEDFGLDLLLGTPAAEGDERLDKTAKLAELGYGDDGDSSLVVSILKFTQMLLDHCGNRSIYASSTHLNSLLNSTDFTIICATLRVGVELAQRYQASVKRMGMHPRQVHNALLSNHYNIDLDRVQQMAQPFIKTPINKPLASLSSSTPSSTSKNKDKAHGGVSKNVATMYANDLCALTQADSPEASGSDARWNGWGDVKLTYYPTTITTQEQAYQTLPERGGASSIPATPTPLRRSSTNTAAQTTPRTSRQGPPDDSPTPTSRTPALEHDDSSPPGQKTWEISQSAVASTPIYQLLERIPADVPKETRYEVVNRLRVAKALTGSVESRQQALKARLLAIQNLAYIHGEKTFIEEVLRHDHDEPRRFQLVYQLAELIHPGTDGTNVVPIDLQAIALSLLEAIANFNPKLPDIFSALNATVNHGVLLYVIRKAVAKMREEDDGDQWTEEDEWRDNLFSLTLHITMAMSNGSRGTPEIISAGLLDIMVEILTIRSSIAERTYGTLVGFLDNLVYNVQSSLQTLVSADGLEVVTNLVTHEVELAKRLAIEGKGTPVGHRSQVVDYEVPFYQQQNLKFLLKFIHHMMSNSFAFGGNTDRLLRNLVDKTALLGSIRDIIENKSQFGSLVWTNSVTILSDFLNNDPTSFAAISEAGLVKSFLEAVTGQPVIARQPETTEEEAGSPENPAPDVSEHDTRPHPPPPELLNAPRDGPPARGILPSSDAISIVPTVLDAISLNNLGMKMVVSSHAFDSYFEIFESPEHVRLMATDIELPSTIGTHFDELARHHPNLRPAIGNAVLDMVARVTHLAQVKAEGSGWGAKLLVRDAKGKDLVADDQLSSHPRAPPPDEGKGKGKAVFNADDSDVAMADADTLQVQVAEAPDNSSPYASVAPYVFACSNFLSAYIANSNLKTSFISKGGIELLLDLCTSPSLPHDFGDTAASKTLEITISQLVEASPIIGLPSLLKRTQSAFDVLLATIQAQIPDSYLARFVDADVQVTNDASPEQIEKLAQGTSVAKALLRAQSLIRTLYHCFPYSSRTSTVTLHPINLFDYYGKLVRSLGPLLHSIVSEELSIANSVPQNWTPRKDPGLGKVGASVIDSVIESGGLASGDLDDTAVSGIISSTAGGKSNEKPVKPSEGPSQSDKSSPRYRNYQTLRGLLQALMSTTFPLLQSMGRALLPRRDRDQYTRVHHVRLAEDLAQTILAQLEVPDRKKTTNDYRYWNIMLHTVYEMLVDRKFDARHSDRSSLQLIAPVLIAFKKHGGLEKLNTMLVIFKNEICDEHAATEDSSLPELAGIGIKKILDLYSLLVNGKVVTDATSLVNLLQRTNSNPDRRTESQVAHNLVVELRMAILPVVRELWDTPLVEKDGKHSAAILAKIISILKSISLADTETNAYTRSEKNMPPAYLPPTSVRWSNANAAEVRHLVELGNSEELAHEALYRSNSTRPPALEYCAIHSAGLAGTRNPIPPEDSPLDPEASSVPTAEVAVPSSGEDERMALDLPADIPASILGEDLIGHLREAEALRSGRDRDTPMPPVNAQGVSGDASASTSPVQGPSTAAESESYNAKLVAREDLDEERTHLRENLIDRCLDVIRAHPGSTYEVSELVSAVLLRTSEDTSAKQEIGETLINALLSFAADDDLKSNGRSIAAYAHLLSLLLQDRGFFRASVSTLKDNVSPLLHFLQVPTSPASEELAPWIPYVLLVFEILLSDDEQLGDFKWKPPTSEDETAAPLEWPAKDVNVGGDDRETLLSSVLELLPRIGKEESLAVSVLRVLVILTRDRTVARLIGDKKNLQRLFVMAKQLSSVGSQRLVETRITSHILIVLRHVIEDEEVVKQRMRSEIRNYLERTQRPPDPTSYLRQLSHVALRDPRLFVEVTNEMVEISRWSPQDSNVRQSIVLKDPKLDVLKDDVAPAVRATEDLSIQDVKPSTESEDKTMADVQKGAASQESKRPVLENPDGVVHFLLCELLNYREVDDKEPSQPSKEPKQGPDATATTSSASSEPENRTSDNKEKKAKSSFKADEHPIFIYRCFLLHCLTELLQSYNRTKMEFINFKRSAPLQTNTPIKPRSSILNYLLADLLCANHIEGPSDTLTVKKKHATASQVQNLLVALVSKTGEKPSDRTRDKFDLGDEPDLLFVRKFVLDTILKSYKDASVSSESFETRYSRMLALADVMHLMTAGKDKDVPSRSANDDTPDRSQAQIRRLMYEKGYLAALTGSIADIDLAYPPVKRTIKSILRVLRILTSTAIHLSHSNILPASSTQDSVDDEIASATSLSEIEDDREETPDLYRNSALGMLEPGRDRDDYSEDSEDDDDEDMYDDEYEDEMDYEEGPMSEDREEDVSDEDEEEAGMGPIEGLPGDLGVVEVTMDDDEEDDEEMDDDDDDDESNDDDELGSDGMDDDDDRIEIIDDEGNPLEDDGASVWESESVDEEDDDEEIDFEAEAQDLDEAPIHGLDDVEEPPRFGDIMRAIEQDFSIDDINGINDRPFTADDDEDAWDGILWSLTMPLSLAITIEIVTDIVARSLFHSSWDLAETPWQTLADGLNPLLRRNEAGRTGSPLPPNPGSMVRLGFPGGLLSGGNFDSPISLINDLVASLPASLSRHGHALHLQITSGPGGEVREVSLPFDHFGREGRSDGRRDTFQEPGQATTFSAESTSSRWSEEVKMIFGAQHGEKSMKLVPALLSYLVPPAIQRDKEHKAREAEQKRKQEEERKKREDEERKAREAKEAEEKIAREKKEAEERERAAAEAQAVQAELESVEVPEAEHDEDHTESDAMEGVEVSDSAADAAQTTGASQPRAFTTIRGAQVDVTELGIDADYLEALPEEFREEVIAQTVSTRRAQAREAPRSSGEQTEVFQEFLDALPDELRLEIVQQERQEQRRREREEARRQAVIPGQIAEAQDMDTASILMTFPPALREQVLMDQGADIMDSLPPEMAAQARRLVRSTNPIAEHARAPVSAGGHLREAAEASGQADGDSKTQRKTVVQMLDKSGVATLLRLMFINVKGGSGSIESNLKHVFKDVCENRQNRLEVVSTLLQILQDGTTDVDAVERSFTHLSIKAKQPKDNNKDPKTPQGLRRTLTNVGSVNPVQPSSETSPLMIVQQCLDLLCYLAESNVHVPSLFLTEHDVAVPSLKRSLSRKGKGKDLKAFKYAINSLLALLDRDLVMESSSLMDSLSQLLSRVTFPLLALERKQKEAAEAVKKLETTPETPTAAAADGTEQTGDAAPTNENAEEHPPETTTPAATEPDQPAAPSAPEAASATATEQPSADVDQSKALEKKQAILKKVKHLHPPLIPVHNLTLIINIFVARECSSRTFKETLSTIKNLSAIPGAMLVFGQELARQAQVLSEKIVIHLNELLPHIEKASSGTEIQGVALSKFSPGASDQNKLLRVLTALDHLFAQKKSDTSGQSDATADETKKQDLLATLYRNSTFNALWDQLGACLGAIRQRENLMNVATILLPLIEALMVVCKDTGQTEAQQSQSQVTKEMLLSSPQPEDHMAGLFFTFTEEHRRVLNELVRNNPSLMKGTFSHLVKNPKVLEFDNKRNWFNRSVHNRNHQAPGRGFPTLQLQVRREHVFHDSFKSLYFKSGDEMKFGKLSIRFHGEEGVDAGGVTREWFQVLSRQMFDPNYALFVPVSSDRTTFHPNKLSGINDEHLMFFKFIGRVIGKALYEGRVLDCYFSRAVYKRILGKPVSVKDMESFDPDYYKSLVWMLENDITDIITETFSVEDDVFGVTRIEDLCEDGRNVPVTEDNKHDYVRLVVEHKLLSSVKEQMENFLKGFHEIIPAELISIFNEQELELLISGLPDISVDDWKSNTEYHNYTPSSPQIQWFWRAVRSLDKEELAKLLQFVTGTSKVPLNGFKELEELDLPEYESYDALRRQLMKAITAGSDYFGFA